MEMPTTGRVLSEDAADEGVSGLAALPAHALNVQIRIRSARNRDRSFFIELPPHILDFICFIAN